MYCFSFTCKGKKLCEQIVIVWEFEYFYLKCKGFFKTQSFCSMVKIIWAYWNRIFPDNYLASFLFILRCCDYFICTLCFLVQLDFCFRGWSMISEAGVLPLPPVPVAAPVIHETPYQSASEGTHNIRYGLRVWSFWLKRGNEKRLLHSQTLTQQISLTPNSIS